MDGVAVHVQAASASSLPGGQLGALAVQSGASRESLARITCETLLNPQLLCDCSAKAPAVDFLARLQQVAPSGSVGACCSAGILLLDWTFASVQGRHAKLRG